MDIDCYFSVNETAGVDKAEVSPRGTYKPGSATQCVGRGPGTHKCGDIDCLYGQDSVEKCPHACGDFQIMCRCVTQEVQRAENQKIKDTILVVGFVFLGLTFVLPLVGYAILQCCKSKCEQPAAVRPGGVQMQHLPHMAQAAAPQMQQLSVTVPPGLGGGSVLHVASPGGAMVQVTVPPGVGPGQAFIVQVPAQAASAAPPPLAQPGLAPQQGFGEVGRKGVPEGRCERCQCCTYRNARCMVTAIPAVVAGAIAIGCLAGGANFDLDQYWNGCGGGKISY